MKKILFLPIAFLTTSCVSSVQVEKATAAAAQIDALFTDHSNKWQQIFFAGNPSQSTISVVMAAASEDRQRFHALMNSFVQYLQSSGAIDPVLFQQQAIELAKAIKEVGGSQ